MIIASYFEGDEDMEVAGKQHDVYHSALSILIDTNNRITRCAKSLLSDKQHALWGTIEHCDHRTLQCAHDLLAATWRFRHSTRQFELQLDRKPEPLVPHTPENLWLWWLRAEIDTWVWEPVLTQRVQLILAHQNQPIGYLAESELCLALMDRFNDVPWLPRWRVAFEEDRSKDMAKIAAMEDSK